MRTCRRAVSGLVICVLVASVAWADDRVTELEKKLTEAQARLDAAAVEVARLQTELAKAQDRAAEVLIDRAAAGNPAALETVFGQLNDGISFIPYRYSRIVKGGAGGVSAERIFAKVVATDDSTNGVRLKCKLIWLMGERGGALVSARLHQLLRTQKNADVLANTLAAMARCPVSPAVFASLRRLVDDKRKIPFVIGSYPQAETLGQYATDLLARWTAKDFATTPGEIVIEEPTFHSLGFEWHITGDTNHNATVKPFYRKKGAEDWKQGFGFLRCRHRPEYAYYKTPVNWGNLLAGSLFDLEPGTEYEVKLTLVDPDGGTTERIVTARTRTEPPVYAGARVLHVVPGTGASRPEGTRGPRGSGTGTREDPLRGIPAADAVARPGDVMLLGPGSYATVAVGLKKDGAPGRPIVWRGALGGKVIIEGGGKRRMLSAVGRKHLHFENLTFQNSDRCLTLLAAEDVVVRRCTFRNFRYIAIFASGTKGKNPRRLTITDNVILGPASWKVGRKRSSYGIAVTGAGHVIAHNRIENCWDCISLAIDSKHFDWQPRTASVDICHNDLRQATDDGVEADQVRHNIRIYRNRLVNTFSSLSFQPIFGGPGYLLCNEMINTTNKPFKMHVHPTGMIVAHNTSLASREALYGGNWHHAFFRNNIILGTHGKQGYWLYAQGSGLDMDYTGYNRASETVFAKLNNVRYRDMTGMTEALGVNRHSVEMGLDAFVKAPAVPGPGVRADVSKYALRLKPTAKAVDAGQVLPGINDGYTGKGPDLGCHETGKPAPHYGPRDLD